MNETTQTEKRQYRRIARSAATRFRELLYPLDAQELKSADLVNIGGGGGLFRTAEPCRAGAVLELEFNLQGWNRQRPGFYRYWETDVSAPVKAIAETVRVDPGAGDRDHLVAFRFRDIDEDDRAGLTRFIEGTE